ncbi:MAG TPA: hypothetical protein VI248_13940, partial [Kineosporiaceae bacterium]
TSSRAAASRAATLAVPAQTLPSTPPPTPVGRGPELGGGTDAPGDPQALPFATGVGLLGVGGLLAARTMLLWRRKVRRRVTR